MTALLLWMVNMAQIVTYWSAESIRVYVKFFMKMWGFLVIVAAISYYIFQHTVSGINLIITHFTPSLPTGLNLAHPTSDGIPHLLAIANTFCPLDEAISYGVMYLDLIILLAVYRLIKTWLPFVGGGV